MPHNTSPSISFTLALHAKDFCRSFSPSSSTGSAEAAGDGPSKSRVLRIFLTMYSRSFAVSSRAPESVEKRWKPIIGKQRKLTCSDADKNHKAPTYRGYYLTVDCPKSISA